MRVRGGFCPAAVRAAGTAPVALGRGGLARGIDGQPSPSRRADELELAALAEQLEEWRQAMERYAAHRTFRTCFRLSAPEEPAEQPADGIATEVDGGVPAPPEPWRVEILLQAKDDPSVLVPAQDVWSSNGDGLRVLGRQIEDPQERLLGGLGHALRLWPELEPACMHPRRPASSSTPTPPSGSCATRSRRSSRPASACWRRRGGASGCGSS